MSDIEQPATKGKIEATENASRAVALMHNPRSMAVVGASDRQVALGRVVEQNEASGVRMYLVNPNRDEVFGRKAYPALTSILDPVDVVLSAVSAELTVDVVESAARIGARAVVISAAGFAETDTAGKERQRRIAEIAHDHDMAICGPNCIGIVNLIEGKSMCPRTIEGIRRGGIALISQSGGLVTAVLSAGEERLLKFSYLISSGNEAVTDLVDYLEFLIEDPNVTAITMIVEQIRRPVEFIAAAYAARRAGKPIIALKLGRSASGKRMGVSHTGAIMGDAREYDALFKQVGILIADDVDDLLDQAQMFSSLPAKYWFDGQRIGVLCASGGSAALTSDAFEAEGLPLVVDDRLAAWMQELIPTNALGNPFDTTGLLYNERDYGEVFDHYLLSEVYDTVLVVSSAMGGEHQQFNTPLTHALLRSAQQGGKRLVAASTTATALGGWVQSYIDAGIGVGGGIAPTVRSLKAMDRFVRLRHRTAPEPVTPVSPHDGLRMESGQGHDVVSFGDAAKLLSSFDLPVAPFVLADPTSLDLETALDNLPPCDRYVVKLANVLHRSDLGAVITEVTKSELQDAATRLSVIADSHGLPREIVVQPQLASRGEVFLGAQSTSALGPIVLFGLGGIFVEVLSDVSARLAPFTAEDARDMVGEIRGHKVMDGVRGGSPWDIDELVAILVRFGNLAAATVGWLDSIDVNPLIVTQGGFSAVDICCIARPG